MRRSMTLFLLLMAGAAAAALAQGQPSYGEDARQEADAAAAQALRTFGALVDERNSASLGFESPEEARSATLGAPFPEFMIRLDRLREYTSGGDPSALLTATDRLTYPVLVREQARSSLTVGRGAQGWAPVGFGAPNYSRLLGEVREARSREERRPVADYFEVRVPALNVSFVGSRGDRGVELTPVVDDARFGFVRGRTLPAERALSAMQEAARKHNGLPT